MVFSYTTLKNKIYKERTLNGLLCVIMIVQLYSDVTYM